MHSRSYSNDASPASRLHFSKLTAELTKNENFKCNIHKNFPSVIICFLDVRSCYKRSRKQHSCVAVIWDFRQNSSPFGHTKRKMLLLRVISLFARKMSFLGENCVFFIISISFIRANKVLCSVVFFLKTFCLNLIGSFQRQTVPTTSEKSWSCWNDNISACVFLPPCIIICWTFVKDQITSYFKAFL